MKTLLEKIEELKKTFPVSSSPEEKYQKIIELGSLLPSLADEDKSEENLVSGCQSQLYVKGFIKDGLFVFTAYSDAFISKGLAALLYLIYNNETPEVILKNPPNFLQDLKILGSLSPSRSNGVLSLYLKLQKLSLNFLTSR